MPNKIGPANARPSYWGPKYHPHKVKNPTHEVDPEPEPDELPPVNTVEPAIASTGYVAVEIVGDDGTWTDADSYTYQWQVNDGGWGDIGAATAKNYIPTEDRSGFNVKLVVTATNEFGSTSEDSNTCAVIYSAPTLIGSLEDQEYEENTGTQEYTVATNFSVLGNVSLSSVTWSLTSPPTGVSITSGGVVQTNTVTSGLLDQTITVRATTAGGYVEDTFNLTVVEVIAITDGWAWEDGEDRAWEDGEIYAVEGL
jgi:hypothetical protein